MNHLKCVKVNPEKALARTEKFTLKNKRNYGIFLFSNETCVNFVLICEFIQ